MDSGYVPALGRPGFTAEYDRVIAIMTRERKWRSAFLDLIDPNNGETIVDVGCGTGTLAIAIKSRAPGARVVGIDPDPEVLTIAAEKARNAHVEIQWIEAMGDTVADRAGTHIADKAVSSLMFHQCLPETKNKILQSMRKVLKPGGLLFVADYGLQRTALMKLLFRQVQMLDGWEGTTPNAQGVLPRLMEQTGFESPKEIRVIQTPTGSISLYTATIPAASAACATPAGV